MDLLVHQELAVWMVTFTGLQGQVVREDPVEHLGLLEVLVNRGQQGHQESTDPAEHQEQQEHRDLPDQREHQEQREPRDLLDHREPGDLLEHQEHQDLLEHLVLMVLQESAE